ncbi:protein SGT1 [Tripterygium wilfordii]|uniref:Protein SGT1 n=1 Tax=Tripterygium wilfordii TaxID=458696 RepID=A0A7J7DM08_TRIWF|nr:protein SGT1 [Tripterygium wilfordii]
MHQVRVRVPASVAQVLKHEPCLISLAVEAFYDRDIDTMKYAATMERFLSGGREKELVCVAVRMSRAMYAHEMLSAPVRRIDEILALPYSAEDFRGQEVPPPDDDAWLYGGEDELNSALQERQKEMELYNSKHRKKQGLKKPQDSCPASSLNYGDFGLDEIAKTMQKFVGKVSSYKNLEEVDLDVDRFFKDMELAMRHYECEDSDNDVDEEGSSSDMDFDESEDGSDNEDGEETFMHTYSDALKKELKNTSLEKSFVRAGDHSLQKNQGTSTATEDMDEDIRPVDVDLNLVKSLLDSFSSQQGQPGPASSLLGFMGIMLPRDDNMSK